MGACISSKEEMITDINIIRDYQKATLKDIHAARESYIELQNKENDKMSITLSEFDEIFSIICSDAEEHYKIYDQRSINQIDAFEVFAVAIVYCNDSFSDKLKELFNLFDFDQNQEISYSELVILMMSTTRGLCKIINNPRPNRKELEKIASNAFHQIDIDNNNKITLDEFNKWTQNEKSITNYLKKFTGVRLIGDIQLQYNIYLNNRIQDFLHYYQIDTNIQKQERKKSFNIYSNMEYRDAKTITQKQPQTSLTNDGQNGLSEDEINDFIKTLLPNYNIKNDTFDKIKITLSTFCSFIAPLIAFTIADENRSNTIDIKELKVLLWLIRQKEPQDIQLKTLLNSIDEDKNKTISRMEWVSYIFLTDQKLSNYLSFNGQIRHLFDEYDKDGNGIITIQELAANLKSIITQSIINSNNNYHQLDETKWSFIDDMMESLSNELIDIIDDNGSHTIDWKEFKSHTDIFENRITQVKDYVTHFIFKMDE